VCVRERESGERTYTSTLFALIETSGTILRSMIGAVMATRSMTMDAAVPMYDTMALPLLSIFLTIIDSVANVGKNTRLIFRFSSSVCQILPSSFVCACSLLESTHSHIHITPFSPSTHTHTHIHIHMLGSELKSKCKEVLCVISPLLLYKYSLGLPAMHYNVHQSV
jgi:hypothetical protein